LETGAGYVGALTPLADAGAAPGPVFTVSVLPLVSAVDGLLRPKVGLLFEADSGEPERDPGTDLLAAGVSFEELDTKDSFPFYYTVFSLTVVGLTSFLTVGTPLGSGDAVSCLFLDAGLMTFDGGAVLMFVDGFFKLSTSP